MKLPGELTPFTFKDTGLQVMIRKVSPLLVNELNRAFPAPRPPAQEVDYGDGVKRIEENPASPEYTAALERHAQENMLRLRKLLIKRGVVCEPDLEAVQELRAQYKEDYGIELEGTDQEIYIMYICAGTDADLQDLLNAVLTRSQPTKAEVDLARVSFPGKV